MNLSNTFKGIERGRAHFAFKCVQNLVDNITIDKKIKEDYKSYVKNVGTMIKTNGLGATIAFINAKQKMKEESVPEKKNGPLEKKENAWMKIHHHVFEYINKFANHIIPQMNDDRLMVKEIITLNSSKYRALTIELLAFFNWLKRFAEGLIEEEVGNE